MKARTCIRPGREAALFGLALLLAVPAHAAAQRDAVIAFVGATLIDGNGGPPLADGTLVVSGDRIVAVGPRCTVRVPSSARTIDARGKFLTPGFVDTDVHVSLHSGIETLARDQPRFTDLVIEHAQLHLKHGVTTLRDSYGMLGPLIEARDRAAGGEAIGPRFRVAGNIVGWRGPWSFTWSGVKPEGLSLFQEQMNDAITRGSGEELLAMEPDSLPSAINRYLDLGPDFIKFGGTGPYSNPVMIGFSERAQRVLVEETHERGRFAETHSTTPVGLRMSLEAGVDVVQHPEILPGVISPELVAMFRDRGVICSMLVNTMTGKPWKDFVERRDAEAKCAAERRDSAQQMRRDRTSAELRSGQPERGLEIRHENAKRLIAGGCITTVGTDNFLGAAPEFRRTAKPEIRDAGIGTILAIEELVELGMTPSQAIVAATRNSARAAQGLDPFGTLESGKLADILMFDADPLADIGNIRKARAGDEGWADRGPGLLPTHPVFHAGRPRTE